ncbi:MAG: hypothetical protein ABSF37_05010 [Sedimentisphaerales bacterium]|jgi:hypothetical protein
MEIDDINEQEINNRLRKIKKQVGEKYAYLHPIKLWQYEKEIVQCLEDILSIKQDLDTCKNPNERTKVLSGDMGRHIEALHVKHAINSHNFLFFSAFLSMAISVISFILGIIAIFK